MKISVVTPSFNSLSYLPRCCASVRDQVVSGLEVEHFVADGGSADGTAEFLAEQRGKWSRPGYTLRWLSEPDRGMYHAINKGFLRTSGDICAYLNCDEQYTAGALAKVLDYFMRNPETDILFGDVVVVDGRGEYICSRQVLKPTYLHTRMCQLNTFTAATFFRRTLLSHSHGLYNPQWKTVGDAVWMLRRLQQRAAMDVLRDYLAVFADTGDNMAMNTRALREKNRLRSMLPWWTQRAPPLILCLHRMRRLLGGLYHVPLFRYDVYVPGFPNNRIEKQVDKPTPYWKDRMSWLR